MRTIDNEFKKISLLDRKNKIINRGKKNAGVLRKINRQLRNLD